MNCETGPPESLGCFFFAIILENLPSKTIRMPGRMPILISWRQDLMAGTSRCDVDGRVERTEPGFLALDYAAVPRRGRCSGPSLPILFQGQQTRHCHG